MNGPSTIPADAHAYITGRLNDLAASEGVRILFAIESGSRAWGFPSADSDYDVRFVYVRTREDYLSVREFRDVIETPTVDDPTLSVPLDLNGWDIRKALRLGLTSNPVLHEWLVSPIRYLDQNPDVDQLRTFAAKAANADVYRYHYDRLCRGAWIEISTDPDRAMVKRYCYALRPALMLAWLSHYDTLPPMDVYSLCAGLTLADDTVSSLAGLFEMKRTGGEKDMIPRVPALDRLIAEQLENIVPRPPKLDINHHSLMTAADELFVCLFSSEGALSSNA